MPPVTGASNSSAGSAEPGPALPPAEPIDAQHLLAMIRALVEVTRAGELTFGGCVGVSRSARLRGWCSRRAAEYTQATTDLRMLAVRRGWDTRAGDGPARAAPNRVDLPAWSGPDDAALFDACERGEELALRRLVDAMDHVLPGDVHTVVRRYIDDVTRSLDLLRQLRGDMQDAEGPW